MRTATSSTALTRDRQHEIEFKKVREGSDTEAIKSAMESMTQKVYQIFVKLYQQEGE